jgi:hypothetical protein
MPQCTPSIRSKVGTKNRRPLERSILLCLMLQHQQSAQEGISQLALKVRQATNLCSEKGGVASLSALIMTDLHKIKRLCLDQSRSIPSCKWRTTPLPIHRPSAGLCGGNDPPWAWWKMVAGSSRIYQACDGKKSSVSCLKQSWMGQCL